MRDRILKALQDAGHGLTPNKLAEAIEADIQEYLLLDMELSKLVILHRADGSAGTRKGEIVLVTLRKSEIPMWNDLLH